MTKERLPKAIAGVAPDGNLSRRQRRRVIIDMALRRARPGAGSSRAFLQRRTAIHQWPDLRPVLDGIPWAVVGGVATRAYMSERATQDLGVIVRRQDCEAAWRRLRDADFDVASQLDAPYFVARTQDGETEVDVLCADFDWMDEAMQSLRRDPAGYPVLALPYLVLMKLHASRTTDIGDIARMLGLADEETRARVREVVERYRPEDSDDLEALILLGEQEIDPPE